MPSPTRVLILNERDSQHPRAGGAEVHVEEVFSRLAARGFEITQATTSFPGCKTIEEVAGTTVWRLGRIRWYYPRPDDAAVNECGDQFVRMRGGYPVQGATQALGKRGG